MKRLLIALITAGLFQAVPVWAKDFDFSDKHHKDFKEDKGDSDKSESRDKDDKVKPAPAKEKKARFRGNGTLGHLKGNDGEKSSSLSNGQRRVEKKIFSHDSDNQGDKGKGDDSNGLQGRGKDFRGGNDHKFSQDHGKDQGYDQNWKSKGWSKPVRISPTLQKRGVKELPDIIKDRKQFVLTDRKRSTINYPTTDYRGKGISAQSFKTADNSVVRNHMRSVVINNTFNTQINMYNVNERQSNHYYWHTGSGYNYCHYYDPYGYHWYGWYIGSNYFWTKYYANRWWWYDSSYDRWCYYNNGNWWWQDPVRVSVVYIYNNDRYDRATVDEDNNQSSNDEPPAIESSPDQSKVNVTTYKSRDETRMVKIVGDDREAFLYDTGSQVLFKPVFLASNVKEVKFSNTEMGKSLQIMVIFKDDSFESFDSRGKSSGMASR